MNTIDQINDTAKELLPLYTDTQADLPDRPLWEHPEQDAIIGALQGLSNILFPGKHIPKPADLQTYFIKQLKIAADTLQPEIEKAIPFRWLSAANAHQQETVVENIYVEAAKVMGKFLKALPQIRALLIEDIKAAYNGDPAAMSYAEVKLAYPGLTAITSHRLAHTLYQLNVPLIPRIMSEWTHSLTGIDIHPGAHIGKGFFIDHGTGVVIGETCHIGDQVKLYQGVTLGAKSFPLDEQGRPIKHIQRHPTVEDHVIIYANSTILGGDTVIGRGSVVAANVFLMGSTPPDSVVTREGNDALIRKSKKTKGPKTGI